MARKKTPNLDTLIPQYAENKSILDDYKKICDEENKQIKELMAENDYVVCEVGGYVATKVIQKRDSIDEDKLLEVMKKHRLMAEAHGIIKTKEYVDVEALEMVMYKGLIDKKILMEIDKCRSTKEVVTLRISKSKEK